MANEIPAHLISESHYHSAECLACVNFVHITVVGILAEMLNTANETDSWSEAWKKVLDDWGIDEQSIRDVADAQRAAGSNS